MDARRTANGVCWYFNTGACAKPDCDREHRTLIGAESNQIPETLWNKRLNKTAPSGQETDSTASARPPKEKGGSGDKGGKRERGPKILGCRFTNNGQTFPRGDKCYFVWAHDKPPMGPPTDWTPRSHNKGPNTPGATMQEETADQGPSASADSSSASDALGPPRGSKPTLLE
jgi:hypothetical protein